MLKSTGSGLPDAVAESSVQEPVSALVSADARTPDEWASEYFPAPAPGKLHPELWQHASTAMEHRWGNAVIVTGAPMRLSRADYLAAIAAKGGEPHEPALFTAPRIASAKKVGA